VLVRGWYAQLIETDQQARGVFERRAGACATVATIGLGGAARLLGLPAVLRGGEGQPISDASFQRARAACSGA
jgi:hypothetical protein